MINDYNLNALLEKYGVNSKKVLKKNSTILDRGEYFEIEKNLKYLITILRIPVSSIEKCPSILYRNVYSIRQNYNFLCKTKIYFSNVGTCLSILSTESVELQKTYYYIMEKYGLDLLNKIPSILRVPVDRIRTIESYFKGKISDINILSASCSGTSIDMIEKIIEVCRINNITLTTNVFRKSAGEIEKIIEICRSNNIEITGTVFHKSSEEIKKIIEICRANNIKITGTVFHKSAEDIEKIIEICRANDIGITSGVFYKSAEEIEKIAEVCRLNNIKLTTDVFRKSAEDIEKIIEVCRSNNIEIIDNLFRKSAEEIEKIVEVCRLNNVKLTTDVFRKPAEEIEKIIEVCRSNNIEIIYNVFRKSAEEIEKIIEICRTNNIKLTGNVFYISVAEIEKNVEYLKENYGAEYLKPLIISKNNKYLKTIFPYLEKLGVLPLIINNASILTFTKDEIDERINYIKNISQEIIVNGKFNSIFRLSRRKFKLRLDAEKKYK